MIKAFAVTKDLDCAFAVTAAIFCFVANSSVDNELASILVAYSTADWLAVIRQFFKASTGGVPLATAALKLLIQAISLFNCALNSVPKEKVELVFNAAKTCEKILVIRNPEAEASSSIVLKIPTFFTERAAVIPPINVGNTPTLLITASSPLRKEVNPSKDPDRKSDDKKLFDNACQAAVKVSRCPCKLCIYFSFSAEAVPSASVAACIAERTCSQLFNKAATSEALFLPAIVSSKEALSVSRISFHSS